MLLKIAMMLLQTVCFFYFWQACQKRKSLTDIFEIPVK